MQHTKAPLPIPFVMTIRLLMSSIANAILTMKETLIFLMGVNVSGLNKALCSLYCLLSGISW